MCEIDDDFIFPYSQYELLRDNKEQEVIEYWNSKYEKDIYISSNQQKLIFFIDCLSNYLFIRTIDRCLKLNQFQEILVKFSLQNIDNLFHELASAGYFNKPEDFVSFIADYELFINKVLKKAVENPDELTNLKFRLDLTDELKGKHFLDFKESYLLEFMLIDICFCCIGAILEDYDHAFLLYESSITYLNELTFLTDFALNNYLDDEAKENIYKSVSVAKNSKIARQRWGDKVEQQRKRYLQHYKEQGFTTYKACAMWIWENDNPEKLDLDTIKNHLSKADKEQAKQKQNKVEKK